MKQTLIFFWLLYLILGDGVNGKEFLVKELTGVPENSQPSRMRRDIANELGSIPFFNYHKISEKKHNLNRSPGDLEKDLEFFRTHGFYFIAIRDYFNGKIPIPEGMTPVLLSFDDSDISHFRILPDGRIDPKSAVGILEDFKKKYPVYPVRATFFVNPCLDYPHNLFGQPEWTKWKLEFLLKNGYEIGNHSCRHINYEKSSLESIESDLRESVRRIQVYLPHFQYDWLATPYGGFPRKEWRHVLTEPSSNSDTFYRHKLVFGYNNRLTLSPFHSKFRSSKIPRLHTEPLKIKKFQEDFLSGKLDLFISDGNPGIVTVPQSRRSELHLDPKTNQVILPSTESSLPFATVKD